MNKKEAQDRIKVLIKEIDHHRYLYHVLDKPSISDAALDSLKHELFRLEQVFPELIVKNSPTQRVGGKPLDKFSKVVHSERMLSLNDAFSHEDVRDWEDRLKKVAIDHESFEYFCELKLDGLAINLRYINAGFIQGSTRGNGKVGEDVSSNVRTIESIPLQLRIPTKGELLKIGIKKNNVKRLLDLVSKSEIEVRGEAIMSNDVFNMLNKKYIKEGRSPLANPRNGVAGSIRQLDSKIAAERSLDFYSYSMVGKVHRERLFETREQESGFVSLLGFKTIEYNKICGDLNTVFDFHKYWEKNKVKLDYGIDGVVVKINKFKLWDVLGVVGKAPRYMMAYKFSAEQATTKVLDVIWQIGRTGVLTPTAVLEPVNVGGATISRATLHNMDEIKRLDLKLNDTIILERAGDVIPKVVEVLKNLRSGTELNIYPPKQCPICHGEVIKKEGEVAHRCVNKKCYAVNLKKIIHWVSKGALDIVGLGPRIVEQLIQVGLVNSVSDLYKLSLESLENLERFAEKSAENLIASIEEKKKIELYRFLFALGIRHVGEESSQTLANLIGDRKKLSDIIKFFSKKDLEYWESIGDFGPIVSKSIYEWWNDEDNISELKKLEEYGVSIKNGNRKMGGDKLKGKKLVLTGSLNELTRDSAKNMIKDQGGLVSNSISAKIDYVVVGEDPGSKYMKAKELGLNILTEEEFLRLIK